VLLPFAAGYYLSYLFRSINALIAGDLVAELGLGAADLDLLTSAYFLVFAAVVLPCGVLQSMLLRPKHMDLGNKVARADLTKNGDPRIYHVTAELVAAAHAGAARGKRTQRHAENPGGRQPRPAGVRLLRP